MEEQDRLLQTASTVVREQAFFMKKAIEQENLKDALKFSSNMICELRTSVLAPRFYYELYMLIFQELQHLAAFFADKSRHGRKLTELYESVQHAGNILPRLYLLVTVGVAYIQSKEAPGAEILRDMAELCKGVQHPIRGLFLRYYLLQMAKDKLQSVASESPQGLEEVVDFILNNFNETTRLWIRVQSQAGPGQRDRVKRERERHELRVLVGASLVRLSQLEGMTRSFYADKVLPRILEQVIGCKDPIAQQYLLDCTVQVFPDDFHLASLAVFLNTCSQTQRQVDLRPVLVNLMTRLRNFLQSTNAKTGVSASEVFGLFRLHLERIMHRTDSKQPGGAGGVDDEEDTRRAEATTTTTVPILSQQSVDSPFLIASKACGNILELYAAFLGFTLSLDPNKYDQVSIVHGMALTALDKYMQSIAGIAVSAEDKQEEDEEDPVWLCPLIEIVETTVRLVPLGAALSLSQFGSLLAAVPKKLNRMVSIAMLDAILEDDGIRSRSIADASTASRFLSVIESLLYDVPDVGGPVGDVCIDAEQTKLCRVLHLFQSEELDVHFELLNTVRSYIGRGGPTRLRFTLPTLISCAQELVTKVHAQQPPVGLSAKKVFQFIHNTCSALVPICPEMAFRLWLASGRIADSFGESFEPIAHEFFTQALICFEEELTDSKSQLNAVVGLVATLVQTESVTPENYEALATKTTQHAARLLKKVDQCRGVLACSHLFHSKSVKDPKRVLECLQRGLKIADVCVQSQTAAAHELFVECLNKYIYYFEVGSFAEIAPIHIQNLIVLCKEHSRFAATAQTNSEGENAMVHLNETLLYLKEKAKEERSTLGLIDVTESTVDRKENVAFVQPSIPAEKTATSL